MGISADAAESAVAHAPGAKGTTDERAPQMSSFTELTQAALPATRTTAARGHRWAVVFMLASLLALMAVPASAAPAGHSTHPVFTIPTPATPPALVGTSTLVRTDSGISMRVETSQLEPGDVVTLWVIVANAPDECEAGFPGLSQCGPGDHLAGRGEISVHYGAGRIVADEGTARYGAHLRVGDTSRALFEEEPGLLDARGAEVILVLKTHGPKVPGLVSEQLHTFAGGCADQSIPPHLTPRPGMLGTPGDNDCAEIQFSVHSPTG